MNGSEMISPRTKDISLSLVPLRRQDLKRTLDSIVGRAAELANTRHGYLFHLEASGAQMVMTAGVGFFERRVGDKIVPGQSIAGMAWQTGETLVENNYSAWPVLTSTFPSTSGNGIIIKGYDPVITGNKCATTFMAVAPGDNPAVYPSYIEFDAVPMQGGILCQNGQWRAVDGGASGTTTYRVFFKDGIFRGSP